MIKINQGDLLKKYQEKKKGKSGSKNFVPWWELRLKIHH